MGRTGIRVFAAGSILALALAACSNGDDGNGGSSGGGGEPAADPVVQVEDSDLGRILVDAEGRTLYAFLPDEQGASTCYDDCEANWPPLAADGEPTGADGVDGSMLGTAEREDGSTQVTYNGWPLYHFASDATADDVNGQGVGDVWYVVSPDGDPIQ